MSSNIIIAVVLLQLAQGYYALAMRHYWQQVMHDSGDSMPHTPRTYRSVATLLLGLSCCMMIASEGPVMGSLLWILAAGGSIISTGYLLTRRPGWLRRLCR